MWRELILVQRHCTSNASCDTWLPSAPVYTKNKPEIFQAARTWLPSKAYITRTFEASISNSSSGYTELRVDKIKCVVPFFELCSKFHEDQDWVSHLYKTLDQKLRPFPYHRNALPPEVHRVQKGIGRIVLLAKTEQGTQSVDWRWRAQFKIIIRQYYNLGLIFNWGLQNVVF